MCLVREGTPGAKSSWWADLLSSAAARLAPNARHPCPGLQELAGGDPAEAPCPSARFSCPSHHWVQCTKPRDGLGRREGGGTASRWAGPAGPGDRLPCPALRVKLGRWGRRLHMGTEAHIGGSPGGPGVAPGAPTESTRVPLASFSPSSTIWKVSGARASPAFTSSARFLRTLSLGIAFFACRGEEA